jgi:hypothetical protein
MGVGDVLRELDSRVLPLLGRAFGRLGTGPARLRLVTAAGLICASAVLLTAVWAADRAPNGAPVPSGDVVRVGVVDGQSVPGYVSASHDELTALLADPASAVATAEVYALVSLAVYVTPEQLAPVLSGLAVAQVYARAQLPGMQTQVVRIPAYRVPQDVVAGLQDAARGRDQEIADYGQLRRALTGDSGADRRLRAAYDRAAALAAAEAVAYRAGCSCVYAAVVRAAPPALDRLTRRPEVRAVDPAPEVRSLDRAEFRPPLPEQMLTSDRPLPRSGDSSGTAGAAAPASSTRALTAPPRMRGGALARGPVISTSPVGSATPSSPAAGAGGARAAVPSSQPPGPNAGTSP